MIYDFFPPLLGWQHAELEPQLKTNGDKQRLHLTTGEYDLIHHPKAIRFPRPYELKWPEGWGGALSDSITPSLRHFNLTDLTLAPRFPLKVSSNSQNI